MINLFFQIDFSLHRAGGKKKMRRPRNPLLAFLFILLLVLPWLMFLFRPGGTSTGHALFWFALVCCLLVLGC